MGHHQPRLHPRHTRIGPGQVFPGGGGVSLLPNSPTEGGANGAPGVKSPREGRVHSPHESGPVPSPSSLTSAWPRGACYLHFTEEEAGPTKAG